MDYIKATMKVFLGPIHQSHTSLSSKFHYGFLNCVHVTTKLGYEVNTLLLFVPCGCDDMKIMLCCCDDVKIMLCCSDDVKIKIM